VAGIVGFPAAQVEHQRALVHEPHGLHGRQRREGLDALAQLVNQHGDGHGRCA
jgi:hypothetical protein